MICISEGNATDIASIIPVMDDAFDASFGEAWTSAQCLSALAIPDCRLLIARSDNNVIGFSMTRWVLDTEELLMIAVLRSSQRSNLGSLLLAAIIKHAKDNKREKLFLEVREGNKAYDFYCTSGFVPIGRRKQYYRGPDGFRPDAITMALTI